MTDTPKKSTRKPRATAAKTTAPDTTAKKVAPKKRSASGNVTQMVSREEIALLAHRLWIERGHQHGHDAEDWFRAEQLLIGKAS
jgi:hypothetical protein